MRYTQPQTGPAKIDRSNPHARGLAHAWMANLGGYRKVQDLAGKAHGVFGTGFAPTTGNNWTPSSTGHYLAFSDVGTGTVDSVIVPVGGTTPENCAGPSGNNFTIQAKARIASQPGYNQCIIGSATNGISLRVDSNNKLQLMKSGVAVLAASSVNVPLGVDIRVAATYNGVTFNIYLNGVIVGTSNSSQTFDNVQYGLGSRSLLTSGSANSNERLSNESRIYYVNVWDRTRSLQEIKEFDANPWQIFDSQKIVLLSSSVPPPSYESSDGNSLGTSIVASTARSIYTASGASSNLSSVTATTNLVGGVSGSASSTSSVSASTSHISLTTATSNGQATSSSVSNTTLGAAGGATGISTIDARTNYIQQFVGSSAGVSIVGGTGSDAAGGTTIVNCVGESTNICLATAYATLTSMSVGYSSGLSSVTSQSAWIEPISAVSAGVSSTAAGANSILQSLGVASGESSVSSVSVNIYQTTANSDSYASVFSVGNYIKIVIGYITGLSTAQAMSQGGVHYTEIGDRFTAKYQPLKYVMKLSPTLKVAMKAK